MLPWRRHRRTTSRLDPRAQADGWQLCSLLLDYPDETLVERLPVLREAAAGLPVELAEPLGRFLDHVGASSLGALQADYVETFDVTRKCALHLTYFLHGDTRNRGVALVQFKQLFRTHGVELTDGDGELPDHLAVVLEFGATVAPDAAWKLLNDHRVGIELLRRALLKRESPWADVVQAVRATLPELQGDDNQALARLISQGPPQETVGLDDAALNAPYAIDPALDEVTQGSPTSDCGGGSTPGDTRHTLGTSIPVGAPR
ncbi:nitrate reductase molybdenum cofactor assembly chaperone [Ornithinimicrobium faecis]|uniref:Nitrate reductase molybdenum cofactor assembly chaperone n=1 Tax=Ornithinimicrobium faecis TaxID=2934158 RepID=A0ABY4Z124_9MICO|nr:MULTISPECIES: nitrate reductase molybdenum cofactor assembly chaperone [unclassified Ornithinimicrobium]USQ82077.1 nitrate reductase molybdenum cofactor assembly chaperone [Ornithinimicrobium sp. HY1793]